MSPPPPPQGSPGTPAALSDDAMREIFLRVPADDPRTLVRAAAVCTSWQSILSDAVFTRQYRAFHGAPPMLGFLHNTRHEKYVVSRFVSTATFRPPACHVRSHWHAFDSRHGLVLFHTPKRGEDFVVCNLVTYDRWRINASHDCSDIVRHGPVDDEGIPWNAAVLCAKDRCDHLYCHGGPFRVALVGWDKRRKITFASVYSSEARKWSPIISIEQPTDIENSGHIAVLGDKVYFQCEYSESIVEYNIGDKKLSAFDPPCGDEEDNLPYALLVGVENGMLLFANVVEHRLYLRSMVAGPNGAEELARRWFIELELVLPPRALSVKSVVGFEEGVGVIFLSTEDGLYTIELNSGRSKKIHRETCIEKVMTYMSFYTRAWGRLPTSE